MKQSNIDIYKKYGNLTIVRFESGTNAQPGGWLCRCDCGQKKKVKSNALFTGHTKSCGCRAKEGLKLRTKHSLTLTKNKLYFTYHRMLHRCFCESGRNYALWGGRGITVCKRWLGKKGLFNFIDDMGDPPSTKHSLDRVDNNGHYEPSNCRWATQRTQLSNRRPYKKRKTI